MKVIWLVLGCLCVALPVPAQTIHGHSQCMQYVADDQPIDPGVTCHLPPLISAQCHWGDLAQGLAHTHVELIEPPLWGVVNDEITLHFQLQLYHVAGHLEAWRTEGYFLKSVIWDATGTATAPSLEGNPAGIVIVTGSVTFNRLTGAQQTGDPAIVHGWWNPQFSVFTRYNDGASTKTELFIPLYTDLNPTAPEQDRFLLSSRCTGNSALEAAHAGLVYGTLASEYTHSFPPILAPISTSQTVVMHAYSYGGAPNPPSGTFFEKLDMDLHHGIPGTTLATETSQGGRLEGNAVAIDPAIIGPGAHKLAIVWDQQSGAGDATFNPGEEITALLVVPITIGESAPPPVDVCPNLDGVQTIVPPGFQLVNGQCVPIPPPPSWVPNTLEPSRNGDLERLCASDGKCIILGTLTTP